MHFLFFPSQYLYLGSGSKVIRLFMLYLEHPLQGDWELPWEFNFLPLDPIVYGADNNKGGIKMYVLGTVLRV